MRAGGGGHSVCDRHCRAMAVTSAACGEKGVATCSLTKGRDRTLAPNASTLLRTARKPTRGSSSRAVHAARRRTKLGSRRSHSTCSSKRSTHRARRCGVRAPASAAAHAAPQPSASRERLGLLARPAAPRSPGTAGAFSSGASARLAARRTGDRGLGLQKPADDGHVTRSIYRSNERLTFSCRLQNISTLKPYRSIR